MNARINWGGSRLDGHQPEQRLPKQEINRFYSGPALAQVRDVGRSGCNIPVPEVGIGSWVDLSLHGLARRGALIHRGLGILVSAGASDAPWPDTTKRQLGDTCNDPWAAGPSHQLLRRSERLHILFLDDLPAGGQVPTDQRYSGP